MRSRGRVRIDSTGTAPRGRWQPRRAACGHLERAIPREGVLIGLVVAGLAEVRDARFEDELDRRHGEARNRVPGLRVAGREQGTKNREHAPLAEHRDRASHARRSRRTPDE